MAFRSGSRGRGRVAGLLVAGLVSVASGPALAEASAGLLTSASVEDLKTLVLAHDGHIVLGADSGGTDRFDRVIAVEAAFPGGLHYVVKGTICATPDACELMTVTVAFARPEGITPEKLNLVRQKVATVVVWTNQDTLGISRTVSVAGGASLANLKANMRMLFANVPAVLDLLQ